MCDIKLRKLGKKEYINKSENDNNIVNSLFARGINSIYMCCYICGYQGQGKTSLILDIIKTFAHKKKTCIYWISAISKIDNTIDDKLKDYDVQEFDQPDVDDEIISELIEKLIYKSDNNKGNALCEYIKNHHRIADKNNGFILKYLGITKKVDDGDDEKKDKYNQKYAKNIIVFDDIGLTPQNQKELILLLRCYRHLSCIILFTSQSYMLFRNNNAFRDLFNVKILFGNIDKDRLFNNIYPAIRKNNNEDVEMLDCIYKNITQLYQFLLIDQRGVKTIYTTNNGKGVNEQWIYELLE